MLSLTKAFCYRAIHHSFIRLPPDRIIFLGIIKHGELNIRLAYAVKRRIFISLIIVVLLIIISFSLPRAYLCTLVSFRIIIYHRLCGLSFYLWYKSCICFYVQRLRKDSNLRCLLAHFLSREAPSTSRTRKQKWAGLDLNQQNPKAPDLQSGPLPITVYLPIGCPTRLELVTGGTTIHCSTT